ncbi:hypothetical protein [Sphingomonas sp. Ant20]|uniref:hypothetical protein n=1 Tax=Sphingomonas sp. Ant20 TaxID=104605 RepID=UPI000B1C2D05|nr:hypothetical protein [Sphingomonas sp. Ant20]
MKGDTATLRALDLAKLDVSNRALQQQIWAIQDAQEAAKVPRRCATLGRRSVTASWTR